MRYRATRKIEMEAEGVLASLKLRTPPIDVELVATSLGLEVERTSLGEDVSGLLVIKGARGTVGVNKLHSPERQRFTIAHEIGHFLLHKGEQELFIDKTYKAVFRDSRSSEGEHRAEIQANQFAAALLMPREFVRREVSQLGFDLGDESTLQEIARRFEVSTQAISFRLSNLELF